MQQNKSKIMITGISGLLGSNLALYYSEKYPAATIVGYFKKNPFNVTYARSQKCNLERTDEFTKLFKKEKPDVLFHTAAITNVDKCEKTPELAYNLNSTVPGILAKLAIENNTKFIFISSDMVYGSDVGPHKESETPNPVNIYARSKVLGEKNVLKENPEALIIRTNFFGWNYQPKLSLAEWIIESLKKKIKITLFYDVFFSPLYVKCLSYILDNIWQRDLVGIFNLGCSKPVSKLDFGLSISEIFNLDSNYIIPYSIDDKTSLVPRPKHMEMAIENIEKNTNLKMPTVENQISQLYEDFNNNYIYKLKKS